MLRNLSGCFTLALIALMLGSCAQPGAPLPPSLELPRPPSDLRATRKGNSVTLAWSEPTLTTDHQKVRYLGPTHVCRREQENVTACGDPIGTISAPLAVAKSRQKSGTRPQPVAATTYTDTLPTNLISTSPDSDITYAVEVLNRNGRSGGLSNLIHVPAIETLPAPSDLAVTLNTDGALLSWTSVGTPSSSPNLRFIYRVYRRLDETKDQKDQSSAQSTPGTNNASGNRQKKPAEAIAGEIPVSAPGPVHFLDSIEWEKSYTYRVNGVSIITRSNTEAQIEGDDSNVVHVFAHDIFPPAIPVGLQAVYSGEGQKPFIDLIWAPVTTADLAGYNIYRSEGGSAPIKLNSDLVKTPSYRDAAVASGKTYTYSVSSEDPRGNESAKSEMASEAVP